MNIKTYENSKEKAKVMVCDVCGHEFSIEPADFIQEEVQNAINGKRFTVTYFMCTDCGEKYIILVSNEMLTSMQKKLKLSSGYIDTKKRGNKRANAKNKQKELEKLTKKKQKLFKEIQSYSTKLKSEFLLCKDNYFVVSKPQDGDYK